MTPSSSLCFLCGRAPVTWPGNGLCEPCFQETADLEHRALAETCDTPRDLFDPDHVPPHWVDEHGNFGGWLSDAEVNAQLAITAEAAADMEPPDDAVSLADLLGRRDATDDEAIDF
jgi:hypothetical protein